MWIPCVPLLPSIARLRLLYVQVGFVPKYLQRKLLTIKHHSTMEKKELSPFVQGMLALRKHEIEEASHHINEERNKRMNFITRIF